MLQAETVREVLPYLRGEEGPWDGHEGISGHRAASSGLESAIGVEEEKLPKLLTEEHVDFLRYTLEEMPSGWTAMDASRPWAVYWALTGLGLLGEDLGARDGEEGLEER